MSTAAVPPSIGSDCALANCIPGSPAKSEWSELSHFLKRASAFHLIYMSHSPQSQWPVTGRSDQSLPVSMRSSSDVAHLEQKKDLGQVCYCGDTVFKSCKAGSTDPVSNDI